MTAAVRATARRWIAFAAAAAIVAHAFGMGLLGPRMVQTTAVALAAELAKPPVAGGCPFHAAVAADLAHAGHGAAAAEQAEHRGDGQGPVRHEKHPPSCEACPLGQSGMALAVPPSVPSADCAVRIDPATPPARLLLVETWPHRTPPARAPPIRTAG